MSIFDTLRWPISDAPTEEEFSVLPMPLLVSWAAETGWNNTVTSSPQRFTRLSLHYQLVEDSEDDLALLRKMIYELV